MLSGVSLGRSCSRDCREHDDGIIADRGESFKRHITGALDSPFIALFHEDRPDESGDRRFVGEDADHGCAPLDLAVQALDGIGAVELDAMLLGEGHVRQHIGFCVIHQGC